MVAFDAYFDGDYDIFARRWDGSSWVEFGFASASGESISDNDGTSRSPSLAIDTEDVPVIAWDDNSSGDIEVYIRRWDTTPTAVTLVSISGATTNKSKFPLNEQSTTRFLGDSVDHLWKILGFIKQLFTRIGAIFHP